jgi:hypothetical protein
MDMIWILVGMPIFCGLYATHCAAKNRREEELATQACAVELPRRMIVSSPGAGLSIKGRESQLVG